MVEMIHEPRPCVFEGGPYHQWSGDFLDVDQDVAWMGPEGGKSFAYKRQALRTGKTDEPVRFKFHRGMTRDALVEAGLPPHMVNEALGLTKPPRPEQASIIVSVRRNERARVWELLWGDEVMETAPLDAIDSNEAAKEWVAAVMFGVPA